MIWHPAAAPMWGIPRVPLLVAMLGQGGCGRGWRDCHLPHSLEVVNFSTLQAIGGQRTSNFIFAPSGETVSDACLYVDRAVHAPLLVR